MTCETCGAAGLKGRQRFCVPCRKARAKKINLRVGTDRALIKIPSVAVCLQEHHRRTARKAHYATVARLSERLEVSYSEASRMLDLARRSA